jgi:hypothetical protein
MPGRGTADDHKVQDVIRVVVIHHRFIHMSTLPFLGAPGSDLW